MIAPQSRKSQNKQTKSNQPTRTSEERAEFFLQIFKVDRGKEIAVIVNADRVVKSVYFLSLKIPIRLCSK